MNFLETIRHNLINQNNRCTEHPIFLVQQKVRDYGVDSGYSDDYVWMDEDWNEVDEEEAEKLEEAEDHFLDNYCEGINPLKGYQKVWYADRWEYVAACFTEQGAKDYIEGMSHRLGETRIYVDSLYRNEEMQLIRKSILKGEFNTNNK